MATTVRRAVTQITDVVFPVSHNAKDVQQQHMSKLGNEYVSNMPLQMALYFNAFFSPFWLTTCIIMLEAKYGSLSTLYRIIILAILVVMTIVEVIRLYLGYLGNLTEKVPELAGFWLLTLLIQVPLILFLLLNEAAIITPLERAVHILLTAFIVFEVIIGYFAIRILVNHQVTKFHLQQFHDLEEIDKVGSYGGYEDRYRA